MFLCFWNMVVYALWACKGDTNNGFSRWFGRFQGIWTVVWPFPFVLGIKGRLKLILYLSGDVVIILCRSKILMVQTWPKHHSVSWKRED
jgi:hypothetical protein